MPILETWRPSASCQQLANSQDAEFWRICALNPSFAALLRQQENQNLAVTAINVYKITMI